METLRNYIFNFAITEIKPLEYGTGTYTSPFLELLEAWRPTVWWLMAIIYVTIALSLIASAFYDKYYKNSTKKMSFTKTTFFTKPLPTLSFKIFHRSSRVLENDMHQ